MNRNTRRDKWCSAIVNCSFTCVNFLDCQNWQHTECLRLEQDDLESEYYFCHLCLPDRHAKCILLHSRAKQNQQNTNVTAPQISPAVRVQAVPSDRNRRLVSRTRNTASNNVCSPLSRRLQRDQELERDIALIRGLLKFKASYKESHSTTSRPHHRSVDSTAGSSFSKPSSHSYDSRSHAARKDTFTAAEMCDSTGLALDRLKNMLLVTREALTLLDASVRHHAAQPQLHTHPKLMNRHNAVDYIASIFPRECYKRPDLSEWLLDAASFQDQPRSPFEARVLHDSQLPFKSTKIISHRHQKS